MASSDKLWFDMGVRDDVSKVLANIMSQAESIQDALGNMQIPMAAINNAAELERALSKIAVAKDRISEAKGLTTDSSQLQQLRDMERSLDKMAKSFEKFSKMKGKDLEFMGVKGMTKFIEEQKNLSLAVEQVKRITGEISAQAKQDERDKIAEANRIDTLKEKYYELYRIRKELQDAILSSAPGTDTTDAINMLNSVTARIGAVKRAQSNGGYMPSSVVGADSDEFFRNVKEKTRELTTATDDYNKTISTTEGIQANLQRMMLDTVSQQKIAGIRKQTTEYSALGQKLTEIQDLMRRVEAEKTGIKNGTITTQTYTREVVNQELEAIQRRYNEALARGRQLEKEDTEAKNQKAASAKRTADAIQMLVHANQGLISSYNRIAQAGHQANNVTIQLQQQMGQYASLYGIERILKSVITIGGQFEVQHVALQNILGDMQQANTLFSQLQDLAIESPKTFMELTAYTKQLSAYQIPANELFDTTKRLADLSSGLGVDMSRLILAYGQVRSAAVLRGQELRQFTEAGIPLVQALANEFTKLNGRVVTTGEVFELISKRAVPFEMVKKILWDMTSEGGQFYNMQAELADTLYGKWQKLQDQWQITLGHIAEGTTLSGKFLKTVLEGLVALTSVFDTMLPMFGMFGAWKASSSMFKGLAEAINKSNGTTAIKNMRLAKEQEANRLMRERLMYGKQLSDQEKRIVAERGKLTSQDYYILATEKQITAQKAHQLMLDGQMSKEHFYKLLQMQGYTREQRKQIALGNLKSIKEGGLLGKVGNGILGFMGGWVGVAMAAAGGIMSLYSNAASKAEEAANLAKGANDSMLSDLKDVNTLYNELTKKAPTKADDITSAIERMSSALKLTGGYTDELQQKLSGITDEREKYTLLYNELEKVSGEYLKMKENVEAYLEAANRVGEGNWFTKMFNDPMSEDLKDLSNANIEKKVAKAQADRYGAALKAELKRFVEEWKGEDPNEYGFAGANWEGIFRAQNDGWRSEFKNWLGRKAGSLDGRREYWEQLQNVIDKYSQSLNEVNAAEREVNRQMPSSLEYYKLALEERAKLSKLDINNLAEWNEDDLRKFNGWINDIVSSMNLDSETADKVRNEILNAFPKEAVVRIKALPVLSDSNLAPWQEDLDDYFKSQKINLPISAQSSLEQIEKQLQTKKQEFQEQMDRGGGILISFGIDLSKLPKSFDEIKDQIPIWMRDYAEKAFNDYREGQSGVESIDKAGKDTGLNVNKKKKTSSGNKRDKQAKELREYMRILSDSEKSYQYWRKNVGDSAANLHVNSEFGDELSRIGEIMEKMGKLPKGSVFKFEDAEQYKQALKDLKDYYQNIYDTSAKSRPELLQAIKEVDRVIADIERKDFEKQVSDFTSKLKVELDALTNAWDIFKQVRDATGNIELAQEISGVSYKSGKVLNIADALKENIKKSFAGAGVAEIPFDINLSEEEYKRRIQESFAASRPVVPTQGKGESDADFKKRYEEYEKQLALYEAKIAGFVNSYGEWQKLQKAVITSDIAIFAGLLGAVNDYDTQIQKIDDELKKTIDANKELVKNGTITQGQADKANAIATTQAEDKKWKLSSQYINLMNNSLALTKTEIEQGLVRAQDMLNERLKMGLITAKEYADEMAKLDELQRNWDKGSVFGKSNALTSYLTGGESGMRNYLAGTISKYNVIKANGGKLTDSEQKQYNQATSTQKGLDKLDKTVGKTKVVFDSLAGALQPVVDIFNQLGMTGVGQVVSGIQGAISGAATGGMAGIAIGGAAGGPIGAAIGAGLSVASSVLGGILSAHDDALQAEIDASKQRQKEMERLSKNVEKALENVLGGLYTFAESEDTERERKQVVDEYNRRKPLDEASDKYAEEFVKAAQRGLPAVASYFASKVNDYRKKAGEKDTVAAFKKAAETQEYYDIQRASMLAQRDELVRQRNAEKDKKDSDDEAIDNYNQQIKELEDSLRTFALDMAKALYDIDIKDWASQLTDAIVEAWEKGEDAAEAYKKKVKEIVKDLTKNMLAQKVVEAAFKASGLDKMIENLMDTKSGVLGTKEFMQLADKVNETAESSAKTITGVLDAMERKGYIDKGDSSSSGVSSNIKTITEQTADLLASYINAIRADVSVNRATLIQILNAVQSNTQMPAIAEAQLQQLQTLVSLARQRNDIVGEMRDMLHKVETGQTQISVK